ncbi:bifunctional hydroxymethylpyrimidine kinase/phosphomethylpyrimidine kinase [Alkalicaulis satelles]|uniref:hydroxymethylpyrimidine kinase n=2 Tax=Alkalicaulis satelles TaxID=2609175 RepID=A0A5M6ZFA0_9PROT|nr:bifunctional hydroxymethylpyrimidine kinase/phosphomethylpyrimidine kinase [Alkalicaulis satelles]
MTDDFGPEHPRGRVLVIAGSDSSGGAGIQADIKTVTALGGYAATAITAVTVQSTEGVSAVHPVPADVIQGQIGAVLGDIGADCIKTGMIASAGVLDAVLQAIAEQGGQTIPLIADPVMVAASGARLVDDSALEAMKTRLLPRAALVTPNIPEAEALTGLTISDIDDQRAAGEAMLKQGAGAALVKGGHGEGADVIDILVTRKGVRLFTRPRLKTRHTHGTGCTLASGIAALMAQGLPLDRAVEAAGDYLHEAIRQAPGLGKGSGPVHHGWTVQRSFASAPLREG